MNDDKPKRPYVRTFKPSKRRFTGTISQVEVKRRVDAAFSRLIGPCIAYGQHATSFRKY